MVPFIHVNRTPAEERYNRSLCKTRAKVECTLGILQSRFGCLTKTKCLRVHGPAYSCKLITACLVMHNICVLHCDHIDPLPQGRHLDVSEPTGDNSTLAG